MRELIAELKELRLHGMAAAWADLAEQGSNAAVDSSRWLIEHLLQAEATDRAMRSVRHQMTAAKFPVHRDLAGFDFSISPVDRGVSALQPSRRGIAVPLAQPAVRAHQRDDHDEPGLRRVV